MGSRARAKSVIESGQPCLTPEVNVNCCVVVLLMKIVWRLLV
jgi:hypothetical protein